MRDELGSYLTQVSWKNLNQAAKDKLLLCLLANLSVAVAGASAMRLPKPPLQKGHLLLDGGETSSAREAAFYNAALMHARTQDDFHPIGNLHIATIVIPAIFAQSERSDSTGEEFLDALAVAYSTAAGLSLDKNVTLPVIGTSNKLAMIISLETVFSRPGTPGQNHEDEDCESPAMLGIVDSPKTFSDVCPDSVSMFGLLI